MNPRKRPSRSGLVVVLAGALAACLLSVGSLQLFHRNDASSDSGGALSAGSGATQASLPYTLTDRVQESVPEAGLAFTAPPTDAAPVLSADQALAATMSNAQAVGAAAGEGKPTIGLATLVNFHTDGLPHLVWKVTYPGSPLIVFGPGTLPREELAQLHSRLVPWVFPVDALTGKSLSYYQ